MEAAMNKAILHRSNGLGSDTYGDGPRPPELPQMGMVEAAALGSAGAAVVAHPPIPLGTVAATAPAAPTRAQAVALPPARQWHHIPQALKVRSQWCVSGGDKAPRIAITGTPYAKVNDPSTWRSFGEACAVAEQHGLDIGYVLHADDPFACIDVDVCNAETQQQKGQLQDPSKWTTPEQYARFEKIVASFDSYTERSRSGLGLHIWVEGKVGKGRRRDGVELYSQERYIACTGDVYIEKGLQPRYQLLQLLNAEIARGSQIEVELEDIEDPETSDWYLAHEAFDENGNFKATPLGKLFSGGWEGDHPSQSEADLELVKQLARHSESNVVVWSAFRLSALGKRDKAARPDYMKRTLAVARTHLASDALQVARGKEIAEALFWRVGIPTATITPTFGTSRQYQLLRDGDFQHLPPARWIVKGLIPEAGVGAIFGDSGTFKSFLALDLLAHISNGKEWFGHRVKSAPTVYVPFEGQGGIPNRIKAWRLAQAAEQRPGVLFSVVPPDDVRTNVAVIMDPMNLRVQADRDKLVSTLLENGFAGGVLCIDTLAHASQGLDENSSQMSEMITIFGDLQRQLGGVVLVIHHSGKSAAAGMRGWSGIHAAMDFVAQCQHEEGKGKLDAKFVLTKVKDGSTGDAYRFSMRVVQLGFDEDGDDITSLSVTASAESARSMSIEPAAAHQHKAEDDFVWMWISTEISKTKRPSRRSLEAQRAEMAAVMSLTQKQLRDSISRLFSQGRVVAETQSGNPWMRAIETPHVPT